MYSFGAKGSDALCISAGFRFRQTSAGIGGRLEYCGRAASCPHPGPRLVAAGSPGGSTRARNRAPRLPGTGRPQPQPPGARRRCRRAPAAALGPVTRASSSPSRPAIAASVSGSRTCRGECAWKLRAPPRPVDARDGKGRPLHGIAAEVTIADARARICGRLCSPASACCATISSSAPCPIRMAVRPVGCRRDAALVARPARWRGRAIGWSRSTSTGELRGRRISAGADGAIGLRITGPHRRDAAHAPVGQELLRRPAAGDPAARRHADVPRLPGEVPRRLLALRYRISAATR